MPDHICPWWFAYTFDNPLRSFFHKPDKIFSPYLKPGMTIVDIGCGMGFFSIGLAKAMKKGSTVMAIDVQPKMLEIARKRAVKTGVADSISFHQSQDNRLPIDIPVDLVLAFWMVHETPNIKSFLQQVFSHLHTNGVLFIAEPKFHVSQKEFEQEIALAAEIGFKEKNRPDIAFSHSVVLEKIT